MYKRILVPIDLADPDLAKPAVTAALMMATPSEGMIRFINVLPLTPVMLAEYVPPDFEVQQRKAAEDALSIVVNETGLPASRVSSTVRQGGIYQEILEEASNMQPDLIVMSSHRPHRHAARTYFLGHGVQNVRHRHVHGTSPCCALGGGWRDLLEKHRMPAALDARTVPRLPP